MAMQFKKPKRNLRVRDSDGLCDNENEEKMDVDTVRLPKSLKEKVSKKVNTLSFGDELNECDDGEEFKVKKSSYSKKIKKQMNKEKMGRDKIENGKKNKNNADTLRPIVKETQTNSEPAEKEIMLTGRAAEMAGYESSDEEPDSYHSTSHRFSNPDQVKILLKKGQIPDAALIHAARKRRQQARDLGEDFIPISTQSHSESNKDNEQANGRRLTREEDELEDSDDDDIIVMSGIVSQAEDRKKNLHITMTDHTNNGDFGDPDELDEDNDWETQQIRKAVTGSQLAAAQQESASMAGMYNIAPHPIQEQVMIPTLLNQKPRFPDSYVPQGLISTMNPDDIINKAKEILNELKEKRNPDQKYFEDMTNEIPEIKNRIELLKKNVPALAECFQFYQDLRGYVTDLVECLDEKMPMLVGLEQRLCKLYEKRRTDLTARRRQDVRDQADEATTMKASSTTHTRSEEQQRRAAEREGRRIRRMRMREIKAISKHADGMSSDEEVPETDASAFRSQIEVIKSDSDLLLDDVLEEFASVDIVLQHMSDWKNKHLESYTEAYVNVCLPKLVGPFVRIEMLTWNPLEDALIIEDMFWYKSMQKYTMKGVSNVEQLSKDVDLELIPKIIEKVVLSKIDQMVTSQWDPLSTKQTKRISSVMKHILDNYPTIDPDSKLLMLLLTNLVDRIRDAVDYDVFIPISTRQVMNTGRMNVFFQRQFNMAVKLLGNILCWHQIIEDAVLIDLAINQILNRYLLTSVRTLQPLEAILKITMIARILPSSWLSYGNSTPKELTSFLNQSKLTAMEIDKSLPQAKHALDKLNEVLKL